MESEDADSYTGLLSEKQIQKTSTVSRKADRPRLSLVNFIIADVVVYHKFLLLRNLHPKKFNSKEIDLSQQQE